MSNCETTRRWSANWINCGYSHTNCEAPVRPAPCFRKEFEFSGAEALLHLCGLGYHELYVNGKRVGDEVLQPVVSQYDRRARYITYDIGTYLRPGKNAIGVMLGDGWYNPSTADVWHFDKVGWADYPKLICELEAAGGILLKSDRSWRFSEDGPLTFTQLRNGECYDARKEFAGWAECGFDDSAWKNAEIIPGPGGVLTKQTMPGCRVTERIRPEGRFPGQKGAVIYDMGLGMTGWARLKVHGEAGSVVRLRYSEHSNAYFSDIDQGNICKFVRSGDFQTDRYTLKGEGTEEFVPRFTYHGFNFVEVLVESGKAEIVDIEGEFVRTAFDPVGSFRSDHEMLNRLFEATINSFAGNFTGIPTDCPHREKNGWTGDASLAVDTGLFAFGLADSYAHFIQTMGDTQRPNGQFSGIVPTGGWGFNWGSGPVWDSAFIVIPWSVYLYTGDDSLIRMNYEKMLRYLDYANTLAAGHIIRFGLGDWCHDDRLKVVDTQVTSTAYYHYLAMLVAKCAALLGDKAAAERLAALGAEIRAAFNAAFYKGDGIYAKGEPTALAVALELGLCPDEERAAVAAKLAEHMENRRCRAEFGIVGAKFVPRALANAGYLETPAESSISPPTPAGATGWTAAPGTSGSTGTALRHATTSCTATSRHG